MKTILSNKTTNFYRNFLFAVCAVFSVNVKWRQTSILNFGKSTGSHLNKTGSSCFSRIFNRMAVLPLTLPLCLVLVLGVNGVMAQIYVNTFTGASACPTNGNTPTMATNSTGTAVSRTTITCNNTANVFNSTTLNNTSSISNTSYIQFSATANSGFILNLTSVSFLRQGSNSAPNQMEVRYSTDGFSTSTTWGSAPVTPTSGTTATWDFADFSTGNGGTVTFRIYPYGTTKCDLTAGAASNTGTFRIDNLTINGTVSAATPSIAISNGTIAAGTPNNGQTNVVLQRYDMAVTSANATLTGLTVTTAGTHAAADLSNLKCWYQTSTTFNAGTATLLSTKTSALGAGSQVFPSFTSQAITSGNTGYIFVTADISSGATNGNTINIASNAFSNISFSSGTKTGTDPVAAGGVQTITVAVPDIALSSPAASAANITVGTTNNVIYRFDLAITTATPSLTGVTINTSTGSNTSGDLTNLKCWYQTSTTFNSGTATLLSTKTTSLAAGSQVFPSFSSQSLTTGSTYYIFITADVPLTATPNNTIIVSAITTSDLTFATGNKTGTANASGTKTIIDCTPADVTSAAALSASSSSVLTWANPACYDEILIVAALASNTGTPTGNGSAYTGNLAYSSGTALGNGFVVYKGSTSSQTVTGLTDGTQYFFKYFTRRGTTWTSGTEVDATPNVAGYYWNGASIAANPAAGGTGTWGTANSWRQPSATGAQATWANNNNAIFAGTAGTVTLDDIRIATGFYFNTSGYVLANSTTQTLTGPIVLGNNVGLTFSPNVNIVTPAGGTVNIGSVSGSGTANITINSAQGSATNVAQRINLATASSSISVPINVVSAGGTGTGTVAGIVATTTGTVLTSAATITNNTAIKTAIGATNGNDITANGVISGSADLMFAAGASGGAGTVTLNAANTYTGATIFNAANSGVIRLGITNALPTGTNVTMANSSSNGGIFDLNGFNQTIGSLTSGVGGGSIRNNGVLSNATLTISGSTSPAAFGLVIADGTSTTALTRAGSGTLTLSGANTYTGATTVNAGTLQLAVGNVGSVGAITSSPIGKSTLNLNGGTLSSNSTSARTVLNATSIGGDITLGDATNTGALTFSAATTISGATRTLTTASAVTFAGAIGDGGNAYGITKAGASTLTLSGANTYTGATTINNGTIQLTTGNDRLPTGTVLSLGQAASTNLGTFDLNGQNQTIAGLNSTSGTNVTASNNTITSASAATLTVSGSGTYGDGTNANSGIIAGSISLVKSGTGTLTLGDVNTYTGTTTINGGTLTLSGSGSIATTSTITVGSGANFDISGRSAALTLAAGQSLRSSATGSNATATVNVGSTPTLTLSAGGLGFTAYGGGATAPMTVAGAGGSLVLNSTPVTVFTSTALAAGTYKLIAKSGSAAVTGIPGTLTMTGSGLAASTTGALSVVSGELILTVTASGPSTDANLSALTTTASSFAPAFASGTIAYTASVLNGVTSTTVTPTKADAGATIQVQVNGGGYVTVASGNASSALPLNVGSNSIDVLVTAEDGSTTKTYTLTVTRAAASSPTLNAGAISGSFGNVCINATTAENSFIITGTALTTANVTIASLSGFTFSTSSGGTYTSSLSLTQSGGAYSQTIYVKFTPTSATVFDGNIIIDGGGASSVNVAVTGSGINGTSSITTTTASSISINGASTGGSVISTTCGTITAKGVAYATTTNPTTPITSNGTGTADFVAALSGLTPNTLYYYRAFATNSNSVTNYGSNLNFTTLHNAPTVGSGSASSQTAINANWTAPVSAGAATFTYEVAISTASDFSSTLSTQTGISSGTLTYQFNGLTAGTTYYFRVRANNAGGSSAWSSISAAYATLSDAMVFTALGTSVTENFNTLASSGTSSSLPIGWSFIETLSNANLTYAAGTGSDNTGNTYSFGSSSDRALGGLRSNTLAPTFGAKMINNTGSTINNLTVSYTGETWRVGAANRVDTLVFQYSLDATSLSTGTWNTFSSLDYANPGQATGSGSMQHSLTISDVISGLTLTNGSTIWFRWNDSDISGNEDGMGIDDISIKPCATVLAPTGTAFQSFCSASSPIISNLSATGTSIQWYAASTGGSALTGSTSLVTGTTYYATQTIGVCESATRTAASVTLTSTAIPTLVSSIIGTSVANGDLLWSGNSSNSWSVASNWYAFDGVDFTVASQIPSASSKVFILQSNTSGICSSNNNAVISIQGEVSDIYIGANTTLTISAGRTLSVVSNWVNHGFFAPDPTSTVLFEGNSAQSVGGNTSTVFANLTVDKITGLLTLNLPITVSRTLSMLSGNIRTSATNLLTVGTTVSDIGSVNWVSGSILGPIKRYFADANNSTQESGIFPVGTDGLNRNAQVNFTSGLTSGGTMTAEYKLGVCTVGNAGLPLQVNGQMIQNYENEGWWEITPAGGNLNTATYSLTLRGNGLSTVNSLALLRIIKSTSHTTWDMSGIGNHSTPVGSQSDFLIVNTGLTGFSFFNIGSGNANPLPVELIDFSAFCDKNSSQLTWKTASEKNSDYFEVEVSTDLVSWSEVAQVTAAGNSSSKREYAITDNLSRGLRYYRLLQIDFDGKQRIYDPISLNCGGTESVFLIYPNPTSGDFVVSIQNEKLSGEIMVTFNTADGKLISTKTSEATSGVQSIYFENNQLPAGIYFVRIIDKIGSELVGKLIVR